MSCLRWPEDSCGQARRIVFPCLGLARTGVQFYVSIGGIGGFVFST